MEKGNRPRRKNVAITVVLWAAVSSGIACKPESRDALTLPLLSGVTVGELIDGRDTTVLLLFDPADCFACSTVLAQWLQYGRANAGRVLLLLTAEPSPEERLQTVLYRIRPNGILATYPDTLRTPAEVLVVSGRIRHYDVVVPGSDSQLLAMLRRKAPDRVSPNPARVHSDPTSHSSQS